MDGCSCSSDIDFPSDISQETIDKTKEHPCYSKFAHDYARMHIPVASSCNISCKYCNRKYDCLHETRPGVTSEVLTPKQAADKFLEVKNELDNLKVVGIAGPGDSLANFKETKRSIELIKKIDPETTFCISTNGLLLNQYAEEIVDLDISHLTVTINAVDPKIGAQIYDYIKYQDRVLNGEEAAKVLLENQLEGLKYLADKDVLCKINIVLIKGINDHHVEEVVQTVKDYGAFMTNIMPLIPAKGSKFENMPLVSNQELNQVREKCEQDLKQMYHCQQCRADAIGKLSQDKSAKFRTANYEPLEAELYLNNPQEKILFAVASKTGDLIDQHFGHVTEFYIYSFKAGKIELVETRAVEHYCKDKECLDKEQQIEDIGELLADCRALLCIRIGYEPKQYLEENGLQCIQLYDTIEQGINSVIEDQLLEDIS
jgi:MoaA/NifB/PqqE/SkfB family radical SAM enzyme